MFLVGVQDSPWGGFGVAREQGHRRIFSNFSQIFDFISSHKFWPPTRGLHRSSDSNHGEFVVGDRVDGCDSTVKVFGVRGFSLYSLPPLTRFPHERLLLQIQR